MSNTRKTTKTEGTHILGSPVSANETERKPCVGRKSGRRDCCCCCDSNFVVLTRSSYPSTFHAPTTISLSKGTEAHGWVKTSAALKKIIRTLCWEKMLPKRPDCKTVCCLAIVGLKYTKARVGGSRYENLNEDSQSHPGSKWFFWETSNGIGVALNKKDTGKGMEKGMGVTYIIDYELNLIDCLHQQLKGEKNPLTCGHS